MKNHEGQFTPKSVGNFEMESNAHFKFELGSQNHWNLQLII